MIYILIILSLSCLSFPQNFIKMKKENGVYTIPCEVNGLKLKFIFDTGASDVCISLSEALFMLKNGYLSESDIVGQGDYKIADGSIVEGTVIILRNIKIGEKQLNNVRSTIIHSLSAPLLLGQSAISQIGKFSIDYSNEYLIFFDYNINHNNFDESVYFPTEYDELNYTTVKIGGNLRLSNNSYSKVITFVPAGARVLLVENINEFWKVIYNGQLGYILENHLTVTEYMRNNKKTN